LPSVRLFIVPAERATEGAEDEIGDREEVSTLPAATAAPARVEQRSLRRPDLDRAMGTGVGRRLGIREHAHREVAAEHVTRAGS